MAAADVSHVIRSSTGSEKDAEIISQDGDVGVDGYKLSFETTNGIQRNENGQLKNSGRVSQLRWRLKHWRIN